MVSIDWSQPIQWEDGTPTEVVSKEDRWGSVAVYVDKNQLPSRFTRLQGGWYHEGRSYVWVNNQSGVPDDRALYTPMKPPYEPPRIVNVSERRARAAMEEMACW